MYQRQSETVAVKPVDLVEMHILDGLSQCKSFREIAEEIVLLLSHSPETHPTKMALTADA